MRPIISILFLLIVASAAMEKSSAAPPAVSSILDGPLNLRGINPQNADEMLAPYLKMAEEAPDKKTRSAIYAYLASEVGSQYPDFLSDKTIELADLALACDQPLVTHIQLCFMKVTGIRCKYSRAKGEELRLPRREAAVTILQGLKAMLDTQKKFQEESGNFSPLKWEGKEVNADSSEEEKTRNMEYLEKTQEPEYQKLYTQYLEIEKAVSCKEGIVICLADIYARVPYDLAELESLLKDYVDDRGLIDQILEETKGCISHREKQAMRRDVQAMSDSLFKDQPLAVQPTTGTAITNNPVPSVRVPQGKTDAPIQQPTAHSGRSADPYLIAAACLALAAIGIWKIRSNRANSDRRR
jgi:hypothetical protein